MTGAFVRVACQACEHEQTIFGKASTTISCDGCGEDLATPTGGKATIHGEIIEVVEER